MTTATKITVYHGTSKDWNPEYPGQGQIFHFGNPPAFQGFWVPTHKGEAEYYLTGEPTDRVYEYEMDITGAVECNDDEMEEWDAVPAHITAILGAEGPDNHVVHDTRCLRFVGEA